MSSPVPNSEDFRRWRRLIKQAKRVLANVQGAGGDLRLAARKAGGACVPWGREERSNPFILLVGVAARFAAANTAGREGLTPELRELTAQCERLMGEQLLGDPTPASVAPGADAPGPEPPPVALRRLPYAD